MAKTSTRTRFARERLKERAARLVRLANLDAPTCVLVSEARLVTRAITLLVDDKAGASQADLRWSEVTAAREASRYCTEEGCGELAVPKGEAPWLCAKHAAEWQQETLAIDLGEDGMDALLAAMATEKSPGRA